MVITELQCVQLFIQYICLVTTLMLDKLPCAAVYCHPVLCVLHIVEWYSEVFDHSVRMLSIMAVLGSHEFGLRIWLEAQGGRQISTGREDIACGSAVLLTLSEGFEIDLSDFEAEDATLKADYLWQVVEVVIGGVPTVLEVRFMCFLMSLGRILLQGSVSTNLFDPMRYQVDLWKLEVGIQLLGNIYLVADIIPPGVHFAPLHRWHPSFSICFLVYLSLHHKFRSQGIGFGLVLLPAHPSKKTSLKVWTPRKASCM